MVGRVARRVVAVAAIRDAWEMNLGGVRDFVAQVWEQIQGIVATGMEIVQTMEEMRSYMARALHVSGKNPVLLDRYL